MIYKEPYPMGGTDGDPLPRDKKEAIMKYIHIYHMDGNYEKREAPTKPTLKEMQELVGGYIEPLQVRHEGKSRTMVVNEEGLLMNLPRNPGASAIAGTVIVGNVFILEGYRL